ncbi:MAG: methylenetetrahydrofolate reductase [Armatimonadetes bacterium]|nr:methylenetetrahydrofolate reductase [Armatimonadota bacterium]
MSVAEEASGGRLESKLKSGGFAVTVEIVPPKVPSFAPMQTQLNIIKKLSEVIDAVNVTDNASANVRLSSLAVCKHLLDEGLEPVLQTACRDRNRIAMQGDLLSALAFGVRNFFCVTGDYITLGDHPMAKPVYDVDSIQLLQIFHGIRTNGTMASGVELKATTKSDLMKPHFLLGAAANPFADPVEVRVSRMGKKQRAGAQFIQTQCIFDLDRMREFMRLAVNAGLTTDLHVLGGIMPVKSARPLEFMRDNVPGMRIPEAVIQRMKNAQDPEAEGVAIAVETIHALREMPGISGVHLMTVNWHTAIEKVLEGAGFTDKGTG